MFEFDHSAVGIHICRFEVDLKLALRPRPRFLECRFQQLLVNIDPMEVVVVLE